MKFAVDQPYADPEKAARKLVEIANAVERAQGCMNPGLTVKFTQAGAELFA